MIISKIDIDPAVVEKEADVNSAVTGNTVGLSALGGNNVISDIALNGNKALNNNGVIESNNSIESNKAIDNDEALDKSKTFDNNKAIDNNKSIDINQASNNALVSNITTEDNKTKGSNKTSGMIKLIMNNLWVVWLAGLLISLFRVLYQYNQLIRKLRRNRNPVTDPDVHSLYISCCNELGIRKGPDINVSSYAKTPMLVGVFSPQIVLQDQIYNRTDLKFAILHELNHYKKFDVFYKWVVQITVCIHWFNPLVYIMASQIKRAGELACDEAVMKGLDADGKKGYGLTLINLAAQLRPTETVLGLNESKKHLKERLTAIMKSNKSVKRLNTLTCILLLIVLSTAALSCSKINDTVKQPGAEAETKVHEEFNESDYDEMQEYDESDRESLQEDDESEYNGQQVDVNSDLYGQLDNIIAYTDKITDNTSDGFSNTIEKLVSNAVDLAMDSTKSYKPENTYTYDQLSKLLYPKAKLIEKDYDDVKKLEINLVTENVIIKQGGDKVHVKYYQWYDDQYNLSLKNSCLVFENKKDNRYLKKSANTYSDIWLPEVIKYMGYDINPEDPKDHNGTIVITVPEKVKLKNIKTELVAGSLTISNISADEGSLENISGNININDCDIAELSVQDISGKIKAENLSGDSAEFDNVSGYTIVTGSRFDDIDITNTSGEIKIDGCSGKLSVENITGDTLISNHKDGNLISINSNSGNVNIKLNDITAYHITYSSFQSSMKVGEKIYQNEADLNSDAKKDLLIEVFSSPVFIDKP